MKRTRAAHVSVKRQPNEQLARALRHISFADWVIVFLTTLEILFVIWVA